MFVLLCEFTCWIIRVLLPLSVTGDPFTFSSKSLIPSFLSSVITKNHKILFFEIILIFINDVTWSLTPFDIVTLFVTKTRHKILNPLLLLPWRHLRTTIKTNKFYCRSIDCTDMSVLSTTDHNFASVFHRSRKKFGRTRIHPD